MSSVPLDQVGTTGKERAILDAIDALSMNVEQGYQGLLRVDRSLSRGLVSFQANKSRSVYRWYKFKEAFSAGLVEYLLGRYGISGGILLDPFAGSGTALFASAGLGMSAEGIELLPIGQWIVGTKQIVDAGLGSDDLNILIQWATSKPWKGSSKQKAIPELRITKGAYSEETVQAMGHYLGCLEEESPKIRSILMFALLCVLERVSFTRKDGQYLRWDHRSSGRRQGKKPFDKGYIPSFEEAIVSKLNEIILDLTGASYTPSLFEERNDYGTIALHSGSCLDVLPNLPEAGFDCIVTSPPYCNRYDYTRTYALELALLGVGEKHLVELRQSMLSCTVENRQKDLVEMNPLWGMAVASADGHRLLQLILAYLEDQKDQGLLNNNGIPRMVRSYFYEMACVVYECSRVLKSGALMMMVNDNVRYAGASIPVDLILSDIACGLGFAVENILALPGGKGNSSQQMGVHGRDPLRKCVYIWRKM